MPLTAQLRNLALSKKYFTLEAEEAKPQFKPKSDKATELRSREATADVLVAMAKEAFDSQDASYRLLAAFAFDYSRKHVDSYRSKHFTHLEGKSSQYYESMALIFNRALSPVVLKEAEGSQWMQMMTKNFMHYGILSSGDHSMKDVISFPVQGQSIPFSEMQVEELGGDFQWKKGDEVLFVTDKEFKLKGYYYCGVSGILPGTARNPQEGNELPPYFKLPASGDHYVWVNTAFKNPTEVCFWGDHGYLGLEDPDGNVAIYGDYGANQNVGVLDAFRSVSVGVEAPDSYIGVPETGYAPKRIKMKITKEQYETLKESAIASIRDNTMRGTILKRNCTRYVCDQLGKIGIHPHTEISAVRYFSRKLLNILPIKFGRMFDNFLSKLPRGLVNFLHFMPVLYVPNMLFGLSLRLATFLSEKNKLDSDVTLADIFFMPWRVSVYHPFELGRWQDSMLKQGRAEQA